MRRSIAALALFRRDADGQTLWLARWNEKWRRFHFVGGHKRPSETFRECVEREVAEELGLTAGADFRCADEPLAHLEYTAWSHGAGQETAYEMELFDVELCRDSARQKVAADSANRWVSQTEIVAGRCADGRPISETMAQLLTKAGLIAEANHAAESPG